MFVGGGVNFPGHRKYKNNACLLFTGCCDQCQRSVHLRKTPAVLHPIPPPDLSFTQFGMDLVGPLTTSKNGNWYISVLTDYLTWSGGLSIQGSHVCSSLVTYLNTDQDNWHDYMNHCLLAHRTSVCHSSKQTPFFLAFGIQPTQLIEEQYPIGP